MSWDYIYSYNSLPIFLFKTEDCKNLKRISLAGSEDSDYVGDSNILMLTMCCPFVQEFRDAEEFGVSPEAIKHMVDGWKDLVSLES